MMITRHEYERLVTILSAGAADAKMQTKAAAALKDLWARLGLK